MELGYLLARGGGVQVAAGVQSPKDVAQVLLGPYLLGVELASMLLLAGLVGAYHLGRERRRAGVASGVASEENGQGGAT
jgi:NADH-quinone oxidoreductase subunit J